MMMRIAGLLIALSLAGCAQLAARYELQDLAQTQVLVADGFIVVAQEPLIVRRPRGDNKTEDVVTWNIGTSGARFAVKDGISIDALVKPLSRELTAEQRKRLAASQMRDTSQVGQTKCTTSEKRSEVTCTLPRNLRSGYYAYTIRLEQDGRSIELDPTVMLE